MKLSQRAKIAKDKIKQKIEDNKEEIAVGAIIIGSTVISAIYGYFVGNTHGFRSGVEQQYDADRDLDYSLAKLNGWRHVENKSTHDILCLAPCVFTKDEALKKPTVIGFKPNETFDISKFMSSNGNLCAVDPVNDAAYVIHHVDVWATR